MKPTICVALGDVQQQIQTFGPDWSVPHLLISKKVKIDLWKILHYIMNVVMVEFKKSNLNFVSNCGP